GSLLGYTDQAYYERHYSIYLLTPKACYELLPMAGYKLDSSRETPPAGFTGAGQFEAYMAEVRGRSFFASEVTAEYGDQIVFLATCTPSSSRSSRDERFVLVCKMVDSGV
ncbi:MAG: class B sortase, partial [Oscillospiraceae bacterium]|nr:class B sortase [Oscillospiraceae bacterium]